jgi:hypothetical protein
MKHHPLQTTLHVVTDSELSCMKNHVGTRGAQRQLETIKSRFHGEIRNIFL